MVITKTFSFPCEELLRSRGNTPTLSIAKTIKDDAVIHQTKIKKTFKF